MPDPAVSAAAERARAAACASAGDPEHAWNRGRLWHLVFWFFMALGAVLLVVSDLSPARRILGLSAIAVVCLAYVLLRPRGSDRLEPRNGVYLAIAIVGCSVACGAYPAMTLLLFALGSQMWVFGGTTRTSAVLAGLLSLGTLAGLESSDGWTADGLLALTTTMAIGLAFSLILGIWISKIINQSRERAVLIADLEAARSQLGASHHAQGVMAERERMAREIHDTLAQGFTSVIMLSQSASVQVERDPAKAAQRLAMIEAVARENLAEARALVAAFSPVGLDGSTLVDAVRRLAERFGQETGLTVSLDLPVALAGLPRDREVVLLRAIQESLANVRRHARATTVVIRVTADGDDAQVEVADDGVGFDATASAGYGLTGMQHRVRDAGGEVDVASTPGAGTRVVVRLPADPVPS